MLSNATLAIPNLQESQRDNSVLNSCSRSEPVEAAEKGSDSRWPVFHRDLWRDPVWHGVPIPSLFHLFFRATTAEKPLLHYLQPDIALSPYNEQNVANGFRKREAHAGHPASAEPDHVFQHWNRSKPFKALRQTNVQNPSPKTFSSKKLSWSRPRGVLVGSRDDISRMSGPSLYKENLFSLAAYLRSG